MELELEQVAAITTRREFLAEPVSPIDDASPLVMMSRIGLEASRPLRHRSPYLDVIRKGVDTRGANGVFFVEIVERGDQLVRIRNLPAEGRNRNVTSREGWVEPEVVRSLLKGSDVSAHGAVPTLGLLLFHDSDHASYPLPPSEVALRYPRAFEYVTNFESVLRSRGRFRNFDPREDGWLGIYSVTTAALARHKVVVKDIAHGLIAAAVNDPNIVPDHTLLVIECSSRSESQRLAQVLNSRVVDYVVRSFSGNIRVPNSFLRYIGVRNLSTVPAVEAEDSESAIADALGLTVDQFKSLDSVARIELEYLQGVVREAGNQPG